MTNIFAGLAIIGIGVFAIVVFIRVLKENEVAEAASWQLKAKHLDSFGTLQNTVFLTPQNLVLQCPELDAYYRNHGISLDSQNKHTPDIYHRSPWYTNIIEMTDPNFGLFEHPSEDGDRLSEYMVNSSECTGTAEDAEKIGLKLD